MRTLHASLVDLQAVGHRLNVFAMVWLIIAFFFESMPTSTAPVLSELLSKKLSNAKPGNTTGRIARARAGASETGGRGAGSPRERLSLVLQGIKSTVVNDFPEHASHEKGLQGHIGVGTLVSNQERGEFVVPLINRA